MSGLIPDTRNQPGLEVVPPVLPDAEEYYQPNTKDAPTYADQFRPTSPHRICGLLSRTFWILFVVVLVVLGAAIGGGVGGGLSAHKSVSTPSPQPSTSSTSSPSSSISSTSSSTSTSTAIPASSTQPGVYRIINIAANTSIDLLNGGTDNGTVIEGWGWSPNDTPSEYSHQAWQISPQGNGALLIFNVQTNSYITAPDNLPAGGNPLTGGGVYGGVPGNSTDPHMQWVRVNNSDNSISFSSQAYPTKVLDLAGGNATNGALVILWEKNNGSNQDWQLVASS